MRLSLSLLLFFIIINTNAQLLIKNTNLVDVEKKKILSGQTVLVTDGKISSVDKNKQYKLPEGTTILEGEGKYLVPGFTDAHVHFFQSGGIYARPDAIDLRKIRPYSEEIKWTHNNMDDLLRRYLSAGITSVIDVGSSNSFLQQRDSFATKTWSPLVKMTGPLLTTWVPAVFKNLGNDAPFVEMLNDSVTRQAVRNQLALKTDFIKIWYIVLDKDIEKGARKNLPLVQAAIDEAHKNNLRVAVHATERITAQLAVEAGADFLVHSVDDEIIPDAFVKLLKEKKTVLCPTLVVVGNYGKVLGDTYHFTTDELNMAHPELVGTIIDYPLPDTAQAGVFIRALQSAAQQQNQATMDSIMAVNLKKLVDGGVTIATGTDAGNTGTQHASSYFAELQAMQKAGLTMWQLLEASTINGAKAMGQEKEWGSIATGKTANMLLLNKNPLDSLANWRSIEWVINKGTAINPSSVVSNTAVQLVQQQLNAYNAHDLDAFLEPYADEVELYEFPAKLLSKGKEQMRKDYVFITQTPKLYCRLQNRVVQGNMVIDHEEVWFGGAKP
ncbi:MAG TPA: amidohydrolase family protein, partial [Chitinophagaceae bacterium]|nr:amidohydrolase family protein [Chitinophagaceae bacterium]